MSWLFSVSKFEDQNDVRESYCHEPPLWTFSTRTMYLAIGGNPDTCFWGTDPGNASGWAIVGIGIKKKDCNSAILTQEDWQLILTQQIFDSAVLDGHFVAVRWKHDRIECFTDQLGLRTLYFGKFGKGTCMSTQLDWVTRECDSSEINFHALGSRWLLFNQLSYESCVLGVERLGPGGRAAFRNGSAVHVVTSQPWLPSFEYVDPGQVIQNARDLINVAINHSYKISLGLSGGLDSRLLLAMLTSNSSVTFETHTFGDPSDPDVGIANQIAAVLGISHHNFDDAIPEPQTCIQGICSFVAQTALTEPCTSFLKLRYYSGLRAKGRLMVDGGFGEFGRRQYLNRLVKLGRSALRSRNVTRILELMRRNRADMFSRDATAQLEEGARLALERALDEMPGIGEIGVENFVDLLAVRTRVPNYGAPSQARLDGEVLSFMPLAQPSFLNAVFGIPVRLRSNAKLYYETIRSLNPALVKFPLVKSGVTYPFGLSSNLTWLLARFKWKLGKGYSDPKPHQLLSCLREYVLDTANSQKVAANSMYDSGKVIEAISRYYRGESRLESVVDWWLTFELWRTSLFHKSG